MRTFRFAITAFVGIVVGLIVLRHFTIAHWFWHPLAEGNGSTCSATDHTGCGYSAWSGGFSDIAEITLVGAVITMVATFWRKHNCHVHKCWRLSWQPHPEHGHPVCRKHHPSGQGRGDHLHARHHTVEKHTEILAKRHPVAKPKATRKPKAPASDG